MTRFSSFVTMIFILFNLSHSSNSSNEKFLQCLSQNSPIEFPISEVVYSVENSSFTSIFLASVKNLRFSSPSIPKPVFIVTPLIYSHAQATVICCRQHGLQIRIRSGGHDYEGLSYTSETSFVILDLLYLRSINLDLVEKTAWVESGATLGELYYSIANHSSVLGFPGGGCPTVGIGGYLSGGGFGSLFRKYGLAADNVIDAVMIDVNGRILDRESMGENLFWAIRGGGAASFGVVVSWKVKLVDVPTIITSCSSVKTVQENGTMIFQKWQSVGHKLDKDVCVAVLIQAVNATIQVTFGTFYLGRIENLVGIMESDFPELGLSESDCDEMGWIDYVVNGAGFTEPEQLLNRTSDPIYMKAASDYVKKPMTESELENLWKWCLENENLEILMDPYGGRMSEISESEIPFPHRKGNLYHIQYAVGWENENETHNAIEWMRNFYGKMNPYVSSNPREAYLNYRDLDLGRNYGKDTTYSEAAKWGHKYFKDNFKRLAIVKGEVDPHNFFVYEQSIPPLIMKDMVSNPGFSSW